MRLSADEVLIAIYIITATNTWPKLGVWSNETLKTLQIGQLHSEFSLLIIKLCSIYGRLTHTSI